MTWHVLHRFVFQSYFHTSCWSSVGNRQQGLQQLSIGANCDRIATVEHEFLHALGFWHEQSRSDRDDYVSIIWDRIQTGQSLSCFLTQALVWCVLGREHLFQTSSHGSEIPSPWIKFKFTITINETSSDICFGWIALFVVVVIITCVTSVPGGLTGDLTPVVLSTVQPSNRRE